MWAETSSVGRKMKQSIRMELDHGQFLLCFALDLGQEKKQGKMEIVWPVHFRVSWLVLFAGNYEQIACLKNLIFKTRDLWFKCVKA